MRVVVVICIALTVAFLAPGATAAVAVAHKHLRPQRSVHASRRKAAKLAAFQVIAHGSEMQAARRREQLREDTQRDHCAGKKYTWMADIVLLCQRHFGDASVWDRSKSAHCKSGFNNCFSSRHVECCTKPVGVKKLEDYCLLEASKKKRGQEDPACRLEQKCRPIERDRKVIIELLDAVTDPGVANGPPPKRDSEPAQPTGPDTTTTTAPVAEAPVAAAAAAPTAAVAAVPTTMAATTVAATPVASTTVAAVPTAPPAAPTTVAPPETVAPTAPPTAPTTVDSTTVAAAGISTGSPAVVASNSSARSVATPAGSVPTTPRASTIGCNTPNQPIPVSGQASPNTAIAKPDLVSVCRDIERAVAVFKEGLARIQQDKDQTKDKELAKDYMEDPQLLKESKNLVNAGRDFALLGAVCVRAFGSGGDDADDEDEVAASDGDEGAAGDKKRTKKPKAMQSESQDEDDSGEDDGDTAKPVTVNSGKVQDGSGKKRGVGDVGDGDDDNDIDIDSSSRDDDDEDDNDEPIMVVNQTAVELLNILMGDMNTALNRVETQIHPYNLRWWRYRWEYSVVEAIILIPGVAVIICAVALFRYFDEWYIRHSMPYDRRDELDTPRNAMKQNPHAYMFDSYRQVLIFVLEFSTAIVALLSLAWLLKTGCIFAHNEGVETATSVGTAVDRVLHAAVAHCVYDWSQVAVKQLNDWLAEDLRLPHLPLVGESYYQQLLDVAFHLLGMFCIYTLFIIEVVVCWRKSLKDLAEKEKEQKMSRSDGHLEVRQTNLLRALEPVMSDHESPYAHQSTVLIRELCPSIDQVHSKTFVGATDITEDEGVQNALRQFPYVLYIEMAHVKSRMVLTTVSFPSLIVLIIFGLTGGLFCFITQFGFFWFLPFVVIISAIMVWLADLYSRRLLLNAGRFVQQVSCHKVSGNWLNLRRVSQLAQCQLLIICYSFSRLLLSPYFWIDYFEWSCVILVAFLFIFLMVYLRCAKVMSNCIQALALPPYVDHELVSKLLKNMKADLDQRGVQPAHVASSFSRRTITDLGV